MTKNQASDFPPVSLFQIQKKELDLVGASIGGEVRCTCVEDPLTVISRMFFSGQHREDPLANTVRIIWLTQRMILWLKWRGPFK
jgi:hypothetical protein